MPVNDEQPSSADFARLDEQMKAVRSDLAEIKEEIREQHGGSAARLDLLVQALAEERNYRVENDNTLQLQLQAAEARQDAAREDLKAQVTAEIVKTRQATDDLRLQFKVTATVVGIVWAVFQWAAATFHIFGH
jgi:hypothetical protein